jgi:hypothetical protein
MLLSADIGGWSSMKLLDPAGLLRKISEESTPV